MPVHTPAERRKNRKSKVKKKSNLAPPFEKKTKTKKRVRKSR